MFLWVTEECFRFKIQDYFIISSEKKKRERERKKKALISKSNNKNKNNSKELNHATARYTDITEIT